MEEIIKNIIARVYPQLVSGLCWPRYAVVTGIADAPADGGLCDEFRPMYAVDVQLLDSQGEPDETVPPLLGVPVSMPAGGTESGILSLPEEGTQVIIQFLNGMPHKPIITAVLPLGLSLVKAKHGESIWQGGPGAFQSCSTEGDWVRTTHGSINDASYERTVVAGETTEIYKNINKTCEEDENSSVGGNLTKTISGKASISSAENLELSSAANLTINAAQDLKLIAGGQYIEIINGLKHIAADKLYIGDKDNNILVQLFELMGVVEQIASSLNMNAEAQKVNGLKLLLGKMIPPSP